MAAISCRSSLTAAGARPSRCRNRAIRCVPPAARVGSRRMRVLVTGASGFIGRVLCEKLLHRGHEVGALVRRPGSEPPGTRARTGELSDGQTLREALLSERPDCVIHLAAEIASQRSERKVREVNVAGTERLLGACTALAGGDPATGPRFVFASTVVTGEAGGSLLTEEGPLPVQTPY